MDARQNDHVRPAVINVGCSSAAVKRSNSARTARAADLVLDSGSERKLGVRALLSKKNFRWRA
jgi:hypothetical protein